MPTPSNRPVALDPAVDYLRQVIEDYASASGRNLERILARPDTPPVLDLLANARTQLELHDYLVTALVWEGHRQKIPPGQMAQNLGLSEDRLRKKYPRKEALAKLADRRRPVNRRTARTVGATGTGARDPRQRLAVALTELYRRSGFPSQRALADELGVAPSYLSRLLSGHRAASWTHVRKIATAAGERPEMFKPLFEVAIDSPPGIGTDPAAYLRNYLAALRYADGNRTDRKIITSAKGALKESDVRTAFRGPRIPDWPVIEALVIALYATPGPVEPLWKAAHDRSDSGLPAESF